MLDHFLLLILGIFLSIQFYSLLINKRFLLDIKRITLIIFP